MVVQLKASKVVFGVELPLKVKLCSTVTRSASAGTKSLTLPTQLLPGALAEGVISLQVKRFHSQPVLSSLCPVPGWLQQFPLFRLGIMLFELGCYCPLAGSEEAVPNADLQIHAKDRKPGLPTDLIHEFG